MRRLLFWLVGTLLAIVGWAVINFTATTQGWFLDKLAPTGDAKAFSKAMTNYAKKHAKGNLALAQLTKGGEQLTSDFFSIGRPVDRNTRFGVASLSKWVTAVAVMVLVEEGQLDLDRPVTDYLKRWQLPPSEFDNDQVTLRRLLSHTAGITDGLGHNGFVPGEPVQPLVEHLTQAADADPGKSGRVEVGIEPGSRWMYSGGSYNLIQLIIEDVTGKDFTSVMQTKVFEPLGMTSTSFAIDRDSEELAQYFVADGKTREYPNYTSLAATGLYTTLNDLISFVRAQIPSTAVSQDYPRLLSDASLQTMRAPIANVEGLDIWGAGVILYAPVASNDNVVGHGGQSPFLNASVRLNPDTGSAIIVMETGNENALASDIGTIWTSWETGKPDLYILRNTLPEMFMRIIVGSGVILLSAIIMAVITWRRRKTADS